VRILVLSKRQYTGKDLLDDRYGRLYEIPASLATSGHVVIGVALSYRRRPFAPVVGPAGMRWLSVNALPAGIWGYPRQLGQVVAQMRPDVIWACSDAFHAIMGATLSRITGIPLVIDLYDNFESFGATRLPGIGPLFRAACRHAAALTVVSHSLRDHVVKAYGIYAPVAVIGNGVRRDLFFPQDRLTARASLGLPADARLIGSAGAITADRDIAVLFDAFTELAAADPSLHLVFAGPRDQTPSRYHHPRIIDLGVLPLSRVPAIYSALDVAVVCNKDSDFGHYCFPQKLFEIIACGTPIVAAALGDVAKTLAAYPESLYRPGAAPHLARQITQQLLDPRPIAGLRVPTWDDWSNSVAQVLAPFQRST
jgi:glycosyltransferase involved in cell wall biosynthesis